MFIRCWWRCGVEGVVATAQSTLMLGLAAEADLQWASLTLCLGRDFRLSLSVRLGLAA